MEDSFDSTEYPFSTPYSHRQEMVEVMDRDLNVLHETTSEKMVDWIVANPLLCETVSIEGVLDLLSIDQFMIRYDDLEEY